MSEYAYSATPPEHWQALCKNSGAFFASEDWQELLRAGFGCETIYGSSSDGGLVISSFKAGPFAVGYLGFPTGGVIGERDTLQNTVSELRATSNISSPVCLRMPLSAFSNPPQLEAPYVTSPETAITDLQNWDSMAVSKKLRRDIRKAEKAQFEITTSDDPALGATLFGIYENTVKRHRGSMRYTLEYFVGLQQLQRTNEAVRIVVARKDEQMAGFAATIREGRTSYYLHGGTDDRFRQESPSDLLIQQAIHLAKNDGCDTFNLMASPADQPMLVRYKEKWGGTTRELRTHTLPLRRSYPLFALAERLYRVVR